MLSLTDRESVEKGLICVVFLSLQHMLMKQQDRIDDRVKDIEEQLYKLESDKLLVEVRRC